MTTLAPASPSHLPAIVALLDDATLPTDDLADAAGWFTVLVDTNDKPLGAVALQPCGDALLLRSLVVAPAHRGTGRGAALVAAALERAGSRPVYLLTTDATAFFERCGFVRGDRDHVPAQIRTHPQFAHLCPDTATVMTRRTP